MTVFYEFKRLISMRYIATSFILLLAVQAVLSFFFFSENNNKALDDDIDGIFEEYTESPETVDSYYAYLKEYNEQRKIMMDEALKNGDYEFVPPDFPKTLAVSSGCNDYTLLNAFYKKYNYLHTGFSETLNSVISDCNANIAEYKTGGVSESSFEYIYQINVRNTYYNNLHTSFNDINPRGWDIYFKNNIPAIFLLLFIILSAPAVYIGAEQSKSVIFPTVNGRIKTAASRFCAYFILIALFVISVNITNLLICATVCGLSPLSTLIQSFESFSLAPIIMNVGVLFTVETAVRIGVCVVFGAFCLFTSMCLHSYALVFILPLAFGGLNYYINTLQVVGRFGFLQNTNLFAFLDSKLLFSKYNVINLSGRLFEQYSFSLYLYIAIFILCLIIILLLNLKRKGSYFAFTNKILRSIPHVPVLSFKTNSIFTYEVEKSLLASRMLIITLIFLGVGLFFTSSKYDNTKSQYEVFYKAYALRLDGEWTQEKSDYIKSEREWISSILSQKDEIDEAFKNSKVKYDDYKTYMNKYYEASAKDKPLSAIEAQEQYIMTEASEGKEVWFIYETGYNKLFYGSFNIVLFLLVITACAPVFADEYRLGFDAQLRCTLKGRGHTFFLKFIYITFFTIIVFLAFNIIDVAYLLKYYDFSSLSAPAASIPAFNSYGVNLGTLIVIFYILKLIGYIFTAYLTLSFSQLTRRTTSALTIISIIYLIPYALKDILPLLNKVNLTNTLSPFKNLNVSWSYLFTFSVVLIFIYISYRKYVLGYNFWKSSVISLLNQL